MDIEYRHDLNKNMLVIRHEGDEWINSYHMNMLLHNEIDGFLKCSMITINMCREFVYDVGGKVSLTRRIQGTALLFEDIKCIILGIMSGIEKGEEYLLSIDKIAFDPELIFFEEKNNKVYLCYYPGLMRNGFREFHKLIEFLMKHTNHKDEAAKHLIYKMHKATMVENYELKKVYECINFECKREPDEKAQTCIQQLKPEIKEAESKEQQKKEEGLNRGEFAGKSGEIKCKKSLKLTDKRLNVLAGIFLFFSGVFFLLDTIMYYLMTPISMMFIVGLVLIIGIIVCFWRKKRKSTKQVLDESSKYSRLETADGKITFYIKKNPFVVGSSESFSDGVIANKKFSKAHFCIENSHDVCFIMDLNSNNGTVVNDKELMPGVSMELKEFDRIKVGKTELIFREKEGL